MRINRKATACLNCGSTLNTIYSYCPNCGQVNRDDNVSFGTLAGDFFSTYFAIDSKFGKSFKPFFIKPGFLTNQYIRGKRETYAHPIRLYLIISIFYFFTVTLAASTIAEKYISNGNNVDLVNSSNNFDLLDEIEGLNDSTRSQILHSLSSGERKKLKKVLNENDLNELRGFITSLDTTSQIDLRKSIGDSIANELGVIASEEHDISKKESSDTESAQASLDFILNDIDTKKIKQLDNEYNLSYNQIYDSLNMGELSYWNELIVKQYIKINLARDEQVLAYIVQNLPIMMLLLIPIFALILKLLYVRSKELYIKHLIHAMHLHSLAYLVYGLFILITIYTVAEEDISLYLNFLGFILVSTYSYVSFLHVYHQHWFKTLVKFIFTGTIYWMAIFLFFITEAVISLLLY